MFYKPIFKTATRLDYLINNKRITIHTSSGIFIDTNLYTIDALRYITNYTYILNLHDYSKEQNIS